MKQYGSKALCRILCLVVCLALYLPMMTGCTPEGEKQQTQKPQLIPEGTQENDVTKTEYQVMAQTEALTLEVNPDTTAFRVMVRETGYVFDSTAGENAGDADKASFTIAYMDTSGVVHYMNTYADSVKKGQYTLEKTDNGIKIAYSLGEIEATYFAPVILPEARYLAYYNAMSSTEQRFMKQLYSLVDLNSYTGEDRREMEEKYPQAKDGRIYVLTSNMQKSIKQRLHDALKNAGYTEDDRIADAEYGGELEQAASPQFHLVVYYELDGDQLLVRIPTAEIYYNPDFPMETLRVLPNFGRPEESGYYLLPDGSGSVMEFRNGKNNLQEYDVNIYGADRSISYSETTFKNKVAVFPIFGCAVDSGNGFLAVMEEGDALASVTAAPGDASVPPYAYASFTVLQRAQISTFSTNENTNSYFITHQASVYGGDYRMRYYFLTGEEASYSGMAGRYRQVLMKDRQPLEAETMPLYVHLLGEVDIEKNVLGVTIKDQLLLTSFQEAKTIVGELKAQGVGAMQVILTGYLNGGYRQGYLKKASLSKAAGGGDSLRELAEYLTQEGVAYAVDADIQYAYVKGLFGGVSSRETVRLLSRQPGTLYPANPAYFYADTAKTPAYILNGAGIEKSTTGLISLLADEGITGVSLRSVGRDINGDYHEKRETDRQDSLRYLLEQTAVIRERTDNLVLSTGIAPFTKFADSLLDLPLSSCNYDITDYSVPFTAMVLSGYVRYTGGSSNLDFSDQSDRLRLLETGAAPACTLCAENGDQLRSSDFTEFYAIEYAYVGERIKEDYRYVAEAVGDCWGQPILGHTRLADNVYETVYANGVHILVNYNTYDVTLSDGRSVGACDYLREGGDAA